MNSYRTGIPFTGYFKKTIPQKLDLDTSSSICSSSCEEGEFRPKFWLDNNEVQLTQPQTTQKSFSPSHKDKEELIILSDESEINEIALYVNDNESNIIDMSYFISRSGEMTFWFCDIKGVSISVFKTQTQIYDINKIWFVHVRQAQHCLLKHLHRKNKSLLIRFWCI